MPTSQAKHAADGALEVAGGIKSSWERLFNNREFGQLVALYSADALMFGSTPGLRHGRAEIREYFEALSPDLKASIGEHAAVQPAANLIVDAGFVEFRLGEKVLPVRLSLVLTNDDDRWSIAQHHASPAIDGA